MAKKKWAKKAQGFKSKRRRGKSGKKACRTYIQNATAEGQQRPKRNPVMDFLAKHWVGLVKIIIDVFI